MVLVEKKIGDNAKAQERTHPFWCYCIIDQHQTDFFCFFQMKTDFAKQTPTGAKRRTGGLPRPDWWKDSTLFGGQVVPLIVLLKNIHFFQFSWFSTNLYPLCSQVVPLIDLLTNFHFSSFLDFQTFFIFVAWWFPWSIDLLTIFHVQFFWIFKIKFFLAARWFPCSWVSKQLTFIDL